MMLHRIRHLLLIAFETLAIVTFLVMLASSLLQVLFRYVFNFPLMWTEELARLMCVLTTYFGGVVVLVLREHIRVDMIDHVAGPRGRAAAALAADVLIGWFLVVFAFGCWLMAQATWGTETATMAWFRMGYIYSAVGFAAVAMLAIVVLDLIEKALALAGRLQGRAAG